MLSGDGSGEGDGSKEGEGVGLGFGEEGWELGDGDGLGDGSGEGDCSKEGDGEGLGSREGDGSGLGLGDGDGEGSGEGVGEAWEDWFWGLGVVWRAKSAALLSVSTLAWRSRLLLLGGLVVGVDSAIVVSPQPAKSTGVMPASL